jgi:hypothetical protein
MKSEAHATTATSEAIAIDRPYGDCGPMAVSEVLNVTHENSEFSATLAALAQRLEVSGTTVVRYKDYIEIRLPILASVRVRTVDGRLNFDPRFGFLPRDRATWATLVGVAAITTTLFLDLGITPVTMAVGFIGLSSAASTVIRYLLTEQIITRVQTVYALLTSEHMRAIGTPEVRGELNQPEQPMRGQREGGRGQVREPLEDQRGLR